MLLNPVTQSTQNVAHGEPRYLGAYVGFWGIVSLQFLFSPSTFYLLSHEYIFVFCKKPSVLKPQQHMLADPPSHVHVCPINTEWNKWYCLRSFSILCNRKLTNQ